MSIFFSYGSLRKPVQNLYDLCYVARLLCGYIDDMSSDSNRNRVSYFAWQRILLFQALSLQGGILHDILRAIQHMALLSIDRRTAERTRKMPYNFFVTGEKGKGKSFLIQRCMEKWDGKIQGFLTLPYVIHDKRKGFYLHSLQEVEGMENDLPISVQYGADMCFPVTGTFERLGCTVLGQALQNGDMIVMDELGRLEKEAFGFQQAVEKVLDSEELTLCAIKKAEVPFLNRICSRKDIKLFDLDVDTFDRVYADIIKEMGRIKKRG